MLNFFDLDRADILLIKVMETLACEDKKIVRLYQKVYREGFFNLTKIEQKEIRTACKKTVDLMKQKCNYNLFVEFNPVVLDDFFNPDGVNVK